MSHSVLSATTQSLKGAGKALECAIGQFRSYFIPSHIRTYRDIVRQHALPPACSGQKIVCFDFTRVEIDYVSGRYVFALVRDFEAAGFTICYRKNFRFLATMRHKWLKQLLLDRLFYLYESLRELPENSAVVEVTDRSSLPENPDHVQVRVRYDESRPQSDREIAMPFSIHPLLYDQWLACPPPDLAAPRSWRVFFSGQTTSERYRADTLPVKFGKMSRYEMLQSLAAVLPAGRLRRIQTAAELEPGVVREPCFVWADTSQFRIVQSEWLGMVTRADFFLACPGKDMPLCHNLIEALARGAVPILEHPEFLDPPLEHEVNCLVFRGREELIKTVGQTFQFDPEHINRLRQGAYAYCQKHLAPGTFARRLLNLPHARVDLLLNAYRTPRRATH